MKFLLLLSLIITLSSCSSYKISNFEKYKQVKTADATEISKPVKKSVVVLPLDDSGEYSIKNEIGKTISNFIESEIIARKYAKATDRSVMKKLKDEITLHEMSTETTSIKGPTPADYAISGKITYAGFYQSTGIDPIALGLKIATKDNNSTATVTKNNVKIEGIAKLIKLPEMESVKEITFAENASRTQPASDAKNAKGASILVENDALAMKRSMMRAVDKILPEFMKVLQPYGTVIDKMFFEGNAIYKINIGLQDGISIGNKVSIERIDQENNSKKNLNLKSVYISNQIGEDFAWLVVKEKEEVNRLKIGDIAVVNVPYDVKAQSKIFDTLGIDTD